MKNTFLILIITLPFLLFSRELEMQYEFIHDKPMDHVAKGDCEIIGVVLEAGRPVQGVWVKTIDKKFKVKSDAEGKFKLTIPAQETQIYAYSPLYEEIVVNKYNFRKGHQVKLQFNVYESRSYEVEKPVIYVYGKEGTKVNIEMETKGELKFSYPTYNNGWQVELGANGELKADSGTYPYLFWDGKQNLSFEMKDNCTLEGFVISKDSSVAFLESALNKLGLNPTEKTDFITYWGPRLIQNDKNFIQFLIDDEYDAVATYSITPEPISVRRVYMNFCNASEINLDNVKLQNLMSFERTGLTVLEWGGSELNPNELIKEVVTK